MRDQVWLAWEDGRIAAHLEGALDQLRTAETARLDGASRAARQRHIAELERYARRRRYPRNPSRSGSMRPALIDAHGTRCALAHLIEASGGGALLHRLRRLDNHAYVREVAEDEGLVAWLAAAGLTVAEAARIQPSYSPHPTPYQCACTSLAGGAAIAKLTAVPPAPPPIDPRTVRRIEQAAPCRALVQEVLSVGDSRFELAKEVEITCPALAGVGARLLLSAGTYRERDRTMARVIQRDAVTLQSCEDGGAHMSERPADVAVTLTRIREGLKAEPGACTAVLEGRPYVPPPPRPVKVAPTQPDPVAVAPARPGPVAVAPTQPDPVAVGPTQPEKPVPIEPTFGPGHYLGATGALLVIGTAAYVLVRRWR